MLQVYIQNEFCEGGSLQKQLEIFRQTGGRFSETELKRLLVHVAKVSKYQYRYRTNNGFLSVGGQAALLCLGYASTGTSNKNTIGWK